MGFADMTDVTRSIISTPKAAACLRKAGLAQPVPERSLLTLQIRSKLGSVMAEQFLRVETYSGFKADERPLRLWLGERPLNVLEVEDRWYSPGETYFRVLASDGDRYILRHVEAQDSWTLAAYRARQSLT